MNAVVKEEKNMIEPKKEIEESVELKEPKVELIDVKIEEYEYRDYNEEHNVEQQSVNTKKKPTFDCQICGKTIVFHCFLSVENHAVTHTNLVKYSCPIDKCDYKSWWTCPVARHLKYIHKFVNPTARDAVRMELSHEENVELMRKVGECFPGVTKQVRKTVPKFGQYEYDCHICQASINEPTSTATFCRRRHAIKMHTEFMLYKCIEPDCDFKSKYQSSVVRHQQFQHEMIAKRKPTRIELTIEQKSECERMFVQCFPEDLEYRIKLKEEEENKKEMEELEVKKLVDMCFTAFGRKRKADEGEFETKKKKV